MFIYAYLLIQQTFIKWLLSVPLSQCWMLGLQKIRIMQRQPSLGSQPGRRCMLRVLHKIERSLMVLLMSCSFLKT